MNNKLYVGNLDFSVSNKELGDLFSEKWKVTECVVIEGKGFGFITFTDDQSAKEAKEEFNEYEFKGRRLKIDIAKENTKKDKSKSFSKG